MKLFSCQCKNCEKRNFRFQKGPFCKHFIEQFKKSNIVNCMALRPHDNDDGRVKCNISNETRKIRIRIN